MPNINEMFTDKEYLKMKLIKEYYNLTWHKLIIKCTDELAEKIDDPIVNEQVNGN